MIKHVSRINEIAAYEDKDILTSDYDNDVILPSISVVAVHEQDIYAIDVAGNLFCKGEIIRQFPSLCNFIISVNVHLVAGGQTGELFDALTGDLIYTHYSPLNCAATFRKNNFDYLIVGSDTGQGIILKIVSEGYQLEAVLFLHNNAIQSLAASETQIFSVSATGATAFHSIRDFHPTYYLNNGRERISNGCAYIKENQFVSVSRDLKLCLFNDSEIQKIKTPHANSIKCIAASCDGQFIATGGYCGEVHIYDTSQKRWSGYRPTVSEISSLCYSKDDHEFLASSYDGNVYQLNLDIKHCEVQI